MPSPGARASARTPAEHRLVTAMRPYVVRACGHADAVLSPIGSFAVQVSWPMHGESVNRRERLGIPGRSWTRPLILHFGVAELAVVSAGGAPLEQLGERTRRLLEDFLREGHDLGDGLLGPLTLRVDHETLRYEEPP